MAFADDVLALNPVAYFRLDETTGGLIDSSGNLGNGTHNGTPDLSIAGGIADGTAAEYNTGGGTTDWSQSPSNTLLSAKGAYSWNFFLKTSDLTTATCCAWTIDGNNYVRVEIDHPSSVHRIIGRIRNAGTIRSWLTNTGPDLSTDWVMVTVTFDAGDFAIWVNGVNQTGALFQTGTVTATPTGTGVFYVGAYDASTTISRIDGSLDEVAAFDFKLSNAQIAALWASASVQPPSSLPMSLSGLISFGTASLPMTLTTSTQSATASLPMRLEAADPTHYQAAAARWSAQVVLDAVDVSALITGDIEIEHAENASGIATFSIIPAAGPLDLDDYERKDVSITFEGRDSAGALTYSVRRFTGITTRAVFDPDAGLLIIEATTDLQGRLEQMDRAAITTLVGGQWSEHVFDDQADGWQYALDRLSTIASEIHADNFGRLVVTPWAAGTPAVTFTDSGRFADSLELIRATRRDLLSRVRVNLDFRYKRLRHREMGVTLVDSIGLCGWLDGGGELPTKGVITSGASGGEWTRISPILFTDLPSTAQPGICGGTNYVPSESVNQFCLAASWTSARRWAQDVTEEYTLDVIASDLEAAIGQQIVNFDYGIEAVYDATDFEQIKEFDGPPTGAVDSPESGDWQLAATDAERTGRTAMQAAQECALARARSLILERARGNTVTFAPVYDPTITVRDTVRVNTPHLAATGKVARLREELDTAAGEPRLVLTLAVSRHGGSGLASDDQLDAAPEPTQPTETQTPRTYFMQWRIGGTLFSPPDSELFDGWITNAYGAARTDPDNMYRERFVVRMPEIEETARQATAVQAAQSYDMIVPEDELTLVN